MCSKPSAILTAIMIFAIRADVDLDATQEGDGVVFKDYRVVFIEDLL